MTREEALSVLQDKSHFDTSVYGYEAIDVAIEALEQEPIIRCKDCEYWTKQSHSLQGRCALSGSYPTGAWYCANAEAKKE